MQNEMFHKCAAAVWLLATCLPSYAQTSIGSTAPSVIHTPIQYPSSAVSEKEQGTVLVKAEVDTSGRVVDATVDKTSGYADLDTAALQSISKWSFSPGTKDGKPQAQWIRVPVVFQLKEAASNDLFSRQNLMAVVCLLVGYLGGMIWLIGFIWSIVLAKRKSMLWLSGMVALWAVSYPLFVATNWSVARRNLIFVGLGIALMGLSIYLMPSQMVPI